MCNITCGCCTKLFLALVYPNDKDYTERHHFIGVFLLSLPRRRRPTPKVETVMPCASPSPTRASQITSNHRGLQRCTTLLADGNIDGVSMWVNGTNHIMHVSAPSASTSQVNCPSTSGTPLGSSSQPSTIEIHERHHSRHRFKRP